MNKEYKVIPFADVKIGQEFECVATRQEMTNEPWIKRSKHNYGLECPSTTFSDGLKCHHKGCLVRIADCDPVEPELDFDTWWDNEGSGIIPIREHDMASHAERVARAGWNAAKAK